MQNIIYEYIRGSQLYGLATENSDLDKSGVFVQNINDILGLRQNYQEQMNVDGNDVVFYELGRWVELLIKGNPNMIEGVFVPKDKMLTKPHKILTPIFENGNKFLTKELAKILTQYAHSQIQKARGLNKAIVNPIEEKKDVLDFCYTFKEQGSIPIKDYLKQNSLYQEYCGLVNIPHMHDVYGLYYDFKKHYNEKFFEINTDEEEYILLKLINNSYRMACSFLNLEPLNIVINTINETNYRGIVGDDSNEVRLSSVEKEILPICYMTYNKSGYSKFCVDYKNYQDWKKKRNPERFKINIESQRNYDVKNISHCIRLLTMGEELVNGKGFLIDRTDIDRDFILSVKKGEWDYDKIMKIAEEKKSYIEQNINTCSLPDQVDIDFFNDILIDMRKQFLMMS